jgi:hypothetical protein
MDYRYEHCPHSHNIDGDFFTSVSDIKKIEDPIFAKYPKKNNISGESDANKLFLREHQQKYPEYYFHPDSTGAFGARNFMKPVNFAGNNKVVENFSGGSHPAMMPGYPASSYQQSMSNMTDGGARQDNVEPEIELLRRQNNMLLFFVFVLVMVLLSRGPSYNINVHPDVHPASINPIQ